MDNYKQALEKHTKDDIPVDQGKVDQIEKEMNRQAKIFNKMLGVGRDHPRDKDRIDIASTSTNVPAPVLYGLRKDHKQVPPGQESQGPPVRPVCAAKTAPNSRVSGFLTRLINDLCDGEEENYEVKSSEEMRSAIDYFNVTVSEEDRKKCKILSFDVKSLYPTTKQKVAAQAVKEMVLNSKVKVMNMDTKEMSKYLAVMMTQDEV